MQGPVQPEYAPPFEFDIIVKAGHTSYKVSTLMIGVKGLEEAVSRLRQETVWKSQYLLVPYDCGGGNAWRCHSVKVFTIRRGQLVHIGSAVTYEKGLFYDTYDHLEITPLTRHADSPIFTVVQREVGGRFVVDPELTWQQNLPTYERNISKIQSAGDQAPNKDPRLNPLIPPLLFDAVLAKYCNRTGDLEAFFRKARNSLRDDQFRIFAQLISRVTPGELVRSRYYGILDSFAGTFMRNVFTEFRKYEIPFVAK